MKQLCYSLLCLGFWAAKAQTPFVHFKANELDTTKMKTYGGILSSKNQQGSLINYNEAISFDGIDDYFEVDEEIYDLSQVTIFSVFQSDNTIEEESEIWGIHGEESSLGLTTKKAIGNTLASDYSVEPHKPVLHTFIQMYRSNLSYPNIRTYSSYGVINKDSTNTYLKGKLAEVIGFKRRLRGIDRKKIESALAIKYGITLQNGEDYITSNKKVIWNVEKNEGFHNHVAGIGKDTDLGVNQKQATSSDEEGLLIMAAETLTPSNKENTTDISNRNFLVWGDNNGTFTKVYDSIAQKILLGRKWKLQTHGSKAKTIATQVLLDASKAFDSIQSVNKYALTIDRSGEGTFEEADTDYVMASSLTNGVLAFDEVLWDTDNSGSDIFTLSLIEDLVLNLEVAESLVCPDTTTAAKEIVSGGLIPYTFELKKDDVVHQSWNSTDDNYTDTIENLGAGVYELVVTDRVGNSISETFTIEEETAVTVELGAAQQLAFEQTILLTPQISNIEKVVSYTWTLNDTLVGTDITFEVVEAGTYTLTVTTETGCDYSDSVEIKGSYVKEFSMFPNPSPNGKYTIDVELSERANINVTVFNLVGKRINSFSTKNKQKVSLNGKPIKQKGVYEVILETPQETVVKKLIVE